MTTAPTGGQLLTGALTTGAAVPLGGAGHSAAIESDAEFRRCLDVVGVNARNWDGNSALHLAYYDARENAVARLTAFGVRYRRRRGTSANRRWFRPG